MKILFTLLFSLTLLIQVSAQNLVSIELLGSVNQTLINQLLLQYGLTADEGIRAYKVLYTMDNLAGQQDTVSGLMVRPENTGGAKRYPRLVWQHGTTVDKFAVPSRANVGSDGSYFFGAQGYVAIAPDFLNMGDDQEGFHPYVHARTEALAAINMMQALESAPEYADVVTDQLFVTGYSQGGHASMALHELIVEEVTDFDVTAAAHLSGPYSLSDIMLNEVILKDTTFVFVGFLPYTILSYQAAYPNLDETLDYIFRAPYVPYVEAFRDGYETGAVGLDVLTQQLLQEYFIQEGNTDYYPSRLLTPEFVDELNDPTSKYLDALRDNDTYDFVNPDPTRLFYCRGDDQVNYLNAIVAIDTLNQLGATDTEAVNLSDDLNHGECVLPAILATLDFFKIYQEVVSSTTIPTAVDWTWVNIGNDLRIYTDTEEFYQLGVYDALGRTMLIREYQSGELIDLGSMARGWTVVRLLDKQGRSASKPIVLR